MEIIKFLNISKIVKKYEIVDFKTYQNGFYIKIEILLKDNSKLFVKEYSDEIKRNYSYQWLDKNNNLIIRWDNSSYHKDIITHPHHKHTTNGIFPSYNIDLINVLKEIESVLN